jgi:hypothetical protein
MKVPEFKEFNDYYEKNPPKMTFDDSGIRHQNEVPLPAKYENLPCKCNIIHELSMGTWYHSTLQIFADHKHPNAFKIVKKCKKCHEILCLKLLPEPSK